MISLSFLLWSTSLLYIPFFAFHQWIWSNWYLFIHYSSRPLFRWSVILSSLPLLFSSINILSNNQYFFYSDLRKWPQHQEQLVLIAVKRSLITMISMLVITTTGKEVLSRKINFILFSTNRQGHPMKPHRIRMTHNLILNYGLYRKMEVYVSR